MINISHTETAGWSAAIRGMRNPMCSWETSDSDICYNVDDACLNCEFNVGSEGYDFLGFCSSPNGKYILGPKDLRLAMNLRNGGTDERKYMRMITVYCDIEAPIYWWKEFDTYKVGTVRNSCSTMHKIHAKEFDIDDFAHDKLNEFNVNVLRSVVHALNTYRRKFLKSDKKDKDSWWQMIQLLGSSYIQKSTVMLNYEVLANMYHSRKNHKLDEWHIFCDWIETLPYSELITGKRDGLLRSDFHDEEA